VLPLPRSSCLRSLLAQLSGSTMDVDIAAPPPSDDAPAAPEAELLAWLAATLLLLPTQPLAAHAAAAAALQRLAALRRRSLDLLGAKLAFYLSLSAERASLPPQPLRPLLLQLHKTAVLRQDEPSQAALINALLRGLLLERDYAGAETLRSKLAWPERAASAQLCRYLFYWGVIRCVRLDYSEAAECLAQAGRKAPRGAPGFRLLLTKWSTLTSLLLGDVPERSAFRFPGAPAALEAAIQPYFRLAAAVRSGDLAAFSAVASSHSALFATDGVSLLVVRLRRTVIRAGLRRLVAAYSRISLSDVAAKLGLESAEDAQAVVAKAVRDGALAAKIDSAHAWLLAAPPGEAYSTSEPAAAFHARVTFCLGLHSEAVQAMQFPDGGSKGQQGESAEARKERLAAEAELAAALDEEEGEGF